MDLQTISDHVPIPAVTSAPLNPLISLVAAVLRACIYLLQVLRRVVAFVTLTIPSLMVRILGWSWTLQLNFPGLLFLSCLVPAGLFLLVRYKYLNKYINLKEVPLSKPDKKSLHPDVLSENSSTPLHNYLDEFLSAIRIFGFLEKPVFHELSRHLQTRRLIAGDSLSLDSDDKSFYCVVDGHVQVFAPSPLSTSPSSSAFPTSAGEEELPLNGYDLLTEVSSGGTLSSLFTILSLFTEDVRLSWDPAQTTTSNPPSQPATSTNTPRRRKPHRANSDVSALDLMPGEDSDRAESSVGDGGSTLGADSVGTATPAFNGGDAREDDRSATGGDYSYSRSSSYQGFRSEPDRGPKFTGGGGSGEERGTVARATVDTTLAVIPADAFRRLTRKFPKASAHIVQVILTRFSRVTFTTAHQYLGLTAEVLRAESSLNSLVSHPLPAEFYDGGGMDALRHKFRPDTRNTVDSDGSSDEGEGEGGDYFNLGRATQDPRRQSSSTASLASSGQKTPGPSRPSNPTSFLHMEPVKSSPKSFHQPIPPISQLQLPPPSLARGGSLQDVTASPVAMTTSPSSSLNSTSTETPATSAPPSSVSSPPPPTPQSQPVFRRSSTRRQVQAGDLLSMTEEFDESSYRPIQFAAQTPRPIRWDNAPKSRLSSINRNRQDPSLPRNKMSLAGASSSIPDFNLRDAVMSSLAKSIGLIQPPPPPPVSSTISTTPSMYSPSATTSLTGSPSPFAMGGGRDGHNRFNSSFGSLGMLERSGPGNGDDETSSVMTGLSSGWGAPGGNGQEELENEVEILYFPKGGDLVKEGEKNAGLFFVIDGFLEVSIPPAKKPGAKPVPSANTTSATSAPKHRQESVSSAARKAAAKNSHLPPISASRPRHGSILQAGKVTDFVPPPVAPGATHLYTVKPGGIAGYLSALSNSASYVDIRAKTDVYVGFLPAEALERLLERRPIVLLTLAKRLISLLSPLVLHIDASLDWMQLNAGQVLFRQGDPSDSIYIVINGRLRALQETEKEGAVETVAEFGQGESIGELDVITTVPRSNTVHAIRDTELARMPMTLFNAISTRHPATTIKFLQLIASRVTKEVDSRSQRAAPPPGALELTPSNLNLKTICILPSSRNVPVAVFANKLRTALEDIGSPTAYLDQTTVMRHLGRHTFSTMGKLKVAGWLAEQEQRYRIVLYVADTAVSSQWTVTCIRQADCILVVGMGDDPSLGEYEKLLLEKKTTARKELVLLHPERYVPSGSTRPWLKERPWISQHHHVELPGIVFPTKVTPTDHDPAAIVAFKHLRDKVQTQIKRFRGLRPLGRARTSPHLSDFARLARRLCGASIGVVLGGGGGRGISHIGFLQAMENEGIPIDIIGGCSIGAFVGGLYAKDGNLLATTGRAKQFSGRMASVWRILSDLTFPTISYTTGHEFNRGIYKAFNDVHLEDLWLPYFCNSTSLRWSRMEIHTTGYAWRAIRASMTLAGLLPPLSENGNMLVDGGYIDNLPVSTMTAMGASRIFAIDVGGVDDTSARSYGDSVSGFWVLINRWNPFSDVGQIPTLTEVTSRLTYVSSIKSLMEAKATPGVLYQAMPVQAYTTMGGFSKFDEIYKIGLEAGTKQLEEWKDAGKLPTGLLDGKLTRGAGGGEGGRSKEAVRLRRNSV